MSEPQNHEVSDTATSEAPSGSTPVTRLSRLDSYFEITQRGSSISTELRSGMVTFFAMAYIIIVNPLILGTSADQSGTVLGVNRVAAVTALAAGIMTILFGVIAKYPFSIATGLGINTLVAVTLIGAEGLTWAEAMGLVVIDGLVIVFLAITGFRTAVFKAIPGSLKAAMGVGIGMFIALIGLVDAGFVTRIPDAAKTTVPVQLGDAGSITSWSTLVFCVGVLLCGALVVKGVKGGLFLGIVGTTLFSILVEALTAGSATTEGQSAGWAMATPTIPRSLGTIPDLSLVGAVDLVGAFSRIGVLAASLLVFTLVLANFFDAMGTMTALGKQAHLVDDQGHLPNMKQALIVEGSGAIIGGGLSSSSNTVFVDSAAGIGDGARTGLANVMTGILFLVAMFLTPLYEIVPIEAAAPVLVIVGAMMMAQVKDIDFTDFQTALPAFLTIVVMPFTYSIANGIGVGFITYLVLGLVSGQAKKIHPLIYIISILFIIYFGIDPIMSLIHS